MRQFVIKRNYTMTFTVSGMWAITKINRAYLGAVLNKQNGKSINNVKLTLTFESLNKLCKIIFTIFSPYNRIALSKTLPVEVQFK